MIFVRHGRALADAGVPTHDWPLDPTHTSAIEHLRATIPQLPVVCSDMRRAIDTARFFGEPTIDPRLGEVSRPWTDDLEAVIAGYFRGETVDGWEPQADARARMQAVVDDHAEAIYVSHGTVLALYLASIVPGVDAMRFWAGLTNPDAWRVDGNGIEHITGV